MYSQNYSVTFPIIKSIIYYHHCHPEFPSAALASLQSLLKREVLMAFLDAVKGIVSLQSYIVSAIFPKLLPIPTIYVYMRLYPPFQSITTPKTKIFGPDLHPLPPDH